MNELLFKKLDLERSWPELYKQELKQKHTCLKLWHKVYQGKAKQQDCVMCEKIYQNLKQKTNDQ
jgi:hypothetical protein